MFSQSNSYLGLTVGAAICLAVTFIFIIIFTVKRKQQVVMASSYLFCLFILIGTLMALVVVILNAQNPPTSSICIAIPFLGHLAYAICFGSLFAKTYRVAIVFGMKDFYLVKISNVDLLKPLFSFMMITVVYLIVWVSLSAPKPVSVLYNGIFYTICQSSQTFWPNIIIIVEAIVLLYGLYLSFQVRNNPSLFNESKIIVGIISQLATFGGLAILLSKALLQEPDTITVIECLGFLVVSLVILLGLFAPKVYHMFTKSHEQTQSSFARALQNLGGQPASVSGWKPPSKQSNEEELVPQNPNQTPRYRGKSDIGMTDVSETLRKELNDVQEKYKKLLEEHEKLKSNFDITVKV